MDSLKATLAKYNQLHLLTFYEELSDDQKNLLSNDLLSIDFANIHDCYNRYINGVTPGSGQTEDIHPLPPDICGTVSDESAKIWRESGFRLISENKVAVVLMAGGLGTRLGVDYPKGMYDVGLPSGKTLFQIQAERLIKIQLLVKEEFEVDSDIVVPWYVMTCEKTHKQTKEFFTSNNFFGLEKTNVMFFQQSMAPCLDLNGKLLLEGKFKLSRSPGGNGGIYSALKSSGMIDDMEIRGVENVHVYCVDNILNKMADPVFAGFCFDKKADCGAKVVQKSHPEEAVGVVCESCGKFKVVEYSEIDKATAERVDNDGNLVFNSGNICYQYFSFSFLKKICYELETRLKPHITKKKIPYISTETGEIIRPKEPNGYKMEKFIFDVYSLAESFCVLSVNRDEEFSPLKNNDSAAKDNPRTSRESLFALHRSYLSAVGCSFVSATGDGLDATGVCELSPLVSYSGEGLAALSGRVLRLPVHIDSITDVCNNSI